MYQKLEGTKNLETLLEILNSQPDRWVPVKELREDFISTLNRRKTIDSLVIKNSFDNTLSYASGLSDRLVQVMKRDVDEKGNEIFPESYRISPTGVRVLAELRISSYSKRLENLTKWTLIATSVLIASTLVLLAVTLIQSGYL